MRGAGVVASKTKAGLTGIERGIMARTLAKMLRSRIYMQNTRVVEKVLGGTVKGIQARLSAHMTAQCVYRVRMENQVESDGGAVRRKRSGSNKQLTWRSMGMTNRMLATAVVMVRA